MRSGAIPIRISLPEGDTFQEGKALGFPSGKVHSYCECTFPKVFVETFREGRFFWDWLQQIAQISPFQMRYDSLLNSKKWPSDSLKGSATPCFLPTLSVLLSCLLPNHPFSNLDFSSLGQPIFLKFHFAVSK